MGAQEDGTNLAVFIHPWSLLGGSMFDPVLQSLKTVFLSRGFHVLLYNSRPSFTGIPEGQDLRELVEGTITEIGAKINRLVIMGYSHGALIASLHPLLPAPVKTSHILLCYPIGVRELITFFRGKALESSLRNTVQDLRSHVFVIYGDKDQYSSVQTYEQWVEQLNKDSKGRLSTLRVRGADHFWQGQCGEEMRAAIGHWLDSDSS